MGKPFSSTGVVSKAKACGRSGLCNLGGQLITKRFDGQHVGVFTSEGSAMWVCGWAGWMCWEEGLLVGDFDPKSVLCAMHLVGHVVSRGACMGSPVWQEGTWLQAVYGGLLAGDPQQRESVFVMCGVVGHS